MAWFDHGGARIYYEEQGSGEPVLLLPGLTGSIAEFAGLRQALAGYRVIAADPPGSGRSGPQPRAFTADYFQHDASAFAALLRHLDSGPAHLLGFSDGGEYGLLMAATMPGIARSVVAWGAAGRLDDPGGHLRAAFYNIVDDPIPALQHYSEYLIATYGEANARATTRSAMNAISAIIDTRGGDISLSQAGNITCPVLLIVGEHDMFVSAELAAQFAARVPRARVLRAEGAGHAVHEDRPAWFERAILDWLQDTMLATPEANP